VVVAGYVLRRLRAAPRRWLPGAVGVAIALAGFLVAIVVPAMAGDVDLRSEVRSLPSADRLVTVVADNQDPSLNEPIDALARTRLRDRGFADVLRLTALRELASSDGTAFELVGVDGLAHAVTVQAGRLPQRCDPDVCEVVQWARDGAPTLTALDPSLHLSVVGTVRRVDERMLAGTFAPSDNAVVVLADGADATSAVRSLELVRRTTGWITALQPGRLTVAIVPTLLRQFATLADYDPLVNLTVKAPDSQLQATVDRAHVTANRLALPIGQAGTLLAGFAILTTLAIRPWHRRGLRVLQLRAVSKAQEWCFAILEATGMILVGAVLGAIVAIVVVSSLASAARVNRAIALRRMISSGPLLATAALLLGYGAITVVLLRTNPTQRPSRRRVRLSDVVGVAAIAVWVFAASRGASSIDHLAAGADALLALTPVLASVAATCVVIRLVPWVRSAARRMVPSRRWPTRLALVSSLGHGVRPAATAAFVATATTLATFALGYRTTLQRSAFDQAAFQVPLDFTMREGAALVRPQTITPTAQWSTDPSVIATDVLRRGLAVRTSGTAVDTIEVIGLNPATIGQLRGWRHDFGARPASQQLAVPPVPADGIVLPAGTTELAITITSAPANLGVGAVLERSDGTWHEIDVTSPPNSSTWVAHLDPTDARFHGFRLGESATSTAHTLHNLGEGAGTDVASLAIHVTLSDLLADHQPIAVDWASLHGVEGQLTPAAGSVDVSLVVQASSSLFLLGEPASTAIPAIVDPVTASTARDGVVTLETSGRGTVAVHVTGVVSQFPSLGSRFAVLDEMALSRQLDRTQPGAGTPNEVWLAASDGPARRQLQQRLTADQLRPLDITVREQVEAALTGNALGRAVIAVFLWSSLVAAFLGVVALVFLTHAERLDAMPVLRSLATDGATPRQLVTLLAVRAVALVVTAAPVGAVAGIVLLRAVRQLVNVSANGTRPVPALRTVFAPWQLGACIGAIVALAVGGAIAVSQGVRRIRRHDALAAPS